MQNNMNWYKLGPIKEMHVTCLCYQYTVSVKCTMLETIPNMKMNKSQH